MKKARGKSLLWLLLSTLLLIRVSAAQERQVTLDIGCEEWRTLQAGQQIAVVSLMQTKAVREGWPESLFQGRNISFRVSLRDGQAAVEAQGCGLLPRFWERAHPPADAMNCRFVQALVTSEMGLRVKKQLFPECPDSPLSELPNLDDLSKLGGVVLLLLALAVLLLLALILWIVFWLLRLLRGLLMYLIRALVKPPRIHWDKQGKHIPGHKNYQPGRSILTADPQKLIEKAGTGKQLGKTPRGQPGFKEEIDFGETIGKYISDDGKTVLDTTKGMIIYAKDGSVHIIPLMP